MVTRWEVYDGEERSGRVARKEKRVSNASLPGVLVRRKSEKKAMTNDHVLDEGIKGPEHLVLSKSEMDFGSEAVEFDTSQN